MTFNSKVGQIGFRIANRLPTLQFLFERKLMLGASS